MLLLMVACGRDVLESDSTLPADTGDSGALPDDPEGSDFLYADHILRFDITLDAQAMDALGTEPSEDVVATFAYAGEAYEVGLHLKGSSAGSFRTLDEKAAFKIDFHQWDPDQTFHGVRRLTLNNMIQDSTMSHEHAAYWLFDRVGVPSPRHGYANVWVNGELYGLYGIVETADEQLVNRLFEGDDDGQMYEGGYGFDLYDWAVDEFPQKEGDETERVALQSLVTAVEACPADGVLALIEAYFDADALFAMWAVELAISDPDGYSTQANNYLLYHAPLASQWTMLPWGPDQGFEDADPLLGKINGRLTSMCLADVGCAPGLYAAIEQVLVTWESSGFADYVDAETARIEADCRADPRSEWGDYGCRDEQALMRDWVRARPEVARAELP